MSWTLFLYFDSLKRMCSLGFSFRPHFVSCSQYTYTAKMDFSLIICSTRQVPRSVVMESTPPLENVFAKTVFLYTTATTFTSHLSDGK